MAEHFLGKPQVQDAIRQQLACYRQAPEPFVQQSHPQVTFVTLEQFSREPEYASQVHQPGLCLAQDRLPTISLFCQTAIPLILNACGLASLPPLMLDGLVGFTILIRAIDISSNWHSQACLEHWLLFLFLRCYERLNCCAPIFTTLSTRQLTGCFALCQRDFK